VSIFNRRNKSGEGRKAKAFRAFEQKCNKEKSINLNPLLAIIINLVPMFLIVLNMRAIVGFEQKNILEATFSDHKNVESKETFNVDIKLYKDTTKLTVRNHKGTVVESKKFKNIKTSKSDIVDYLTAAEYNFDHLNILTPGSEVKFDEVGQAIDLSKIKIAEDSKNIFTNFSIGNIL